MSFTNFCRRNLWIVCAFISSITFCISNAAKTELAEETGTVTIFYNAIGQLLTSLIYLIYACSTNFNDRKVFWQKQNLIVHGKFECRNFIGFMCYQAIQLIILFFVFYTISFSVKADLNTGISIAIWSLTPLI